MILWPFSLTLFRLLLGPVSFWCGLHGAPRLVYLPILLLGVLSDIFDGLLARRLGVSRPWLRRFDSAADVVFYLGLLGTTWYVAQPVFMTVLRPVIALLIVEAACIAVSLLRFGVPPATHCYSAKTYGLVLFFAFVAVLSFGAGPWAMYAMVVAGLLANTEVLAILLLARAAPVDVPTVFKLRR